MTARVTVLALAAASAACQAIGQGARTLIVRGDDLSAPVSLTTSFTIPIAGDSSILGLRAIVPDRHSARIRTFSLNWNVAAGENAYWLDVGTSTETFAASRGERAKETRVSLDRFGNLLLVDEVALVHRLSASILSNGGIVLAFAGHGVWPTENSRSLPNVWFELMTRDTLGNVQTRVVDPFGHTKSKLFAMTAARTQIAVLATSKIALEPAVATAGPVPKARRLLSVGRLDKTASIPSYVPVPLRI